MKDLRCFIAMAFEKPDTERLYDKIIAVLLKKKNILPRRIDKIQHNDDITQKIIKEIKGADFVIADLTYARPSVYYEAGFAERNIQVIYTVRSDHFKFKKDDEYGNHRVHFDLQSKNIIKWENENDVLFRRTLRKRLDLVLQPLKQNKLKSELEAREKERFKKLSPDQKFKMCSLCLDKYLKKYNFKKVKDKLNKSGFLTNFACINNTGLDVSSRIIWKLNKLDYNQLGYENVAWEYENHLYDYFKTQHKKCIKHLAYAVIVVSPNKINFNRLIGYKGNYRNDMYKDVRYLSSVTKTCLTVNNEKVYIKRSKLYILIDNILSKKTLDGKCHNAFELLLKLPNTN